VETLDDVLAAARNIFKALDCEYVLIKMGERGMALVSKKGSTSPFKLLPLRCMT